MSDFLGNLAGRSMGLAKPIQPWIAPLYEPHGREGGLISERPGSREVAGEARSHGDPAEGARDEQAPVARKRRPFLPSEPAQSEKRQEGEPQQARPVESVRPEQPGGFRLPMTIGPGDLAHEAPEAVAKQARPFPPSASIIARPSHAPVKVEIPARGRRLIKTASERLKRVEPAAALEMTRPADSVARPSDIGKVWAPNDHPEKEAERVPYLSPAPASPAAAVRSPAITRSGPPIPPAMPAPMPSPAEPPVRITIGRVEVRAVFPEPAVRRTPPPRSKPTLSLDDYLKQSNRGNR